MFNLFSDLTAKVGTANFLDLPIPFAAVATDLETGEMVVLKQGSLAGAMRASMAIPGIFDPWTYEGRLLVDGGLVANLPVSAARALFPGYPVVAVDVAAAVAVVVSVEALVLIEVMKIVVVVMKIGRTRSRVPARTASRRASPCRRLRLM